ncbi:unnamed protein product [Rhizopus stolonifer]
MTSVDGSMHDVLVGEFASSKLGPCKFVSDHLKVLRGMKVILDHIVNQELTTVHDARRLIVPSFQANGLDGEMKIMKLYAPGLYTIQHMGSIDIPSNINSLHDLRKKLIPRLRFMKYHALKNALILSKSLEKEARLKKRKSVSYRRSPSYDDVETSTKWTRSTWFPSQRAGAPIVISTDII